jgi:CheY-like chemotaxis protein
LRYPSPIEGRSLRIKLGQERLAAEIFLLAGTTRQIASGILLEMALRCLLVDDSTHFLEAASNLLEGQGLTVVGMASTGSEALARVRELEPDVTIVDVNLNGESGFDLAWQLAAFSNGSPTRTILMSTHSESELAELVAVTPVLGFVSKSELSGGAIRDFLADRNHGRGCRHEALVYSSPDELADATVPYVQEGLARGEHLLAVLREGNRAVLQQALGGDADRIEFADALAWYQSPERAFQQYARYVDDHLAGGAARVRVVAEVIWPRSSATASVAGWKRYEAGVSVALAALPVSFICTYDTRELDPGIVADARRTHPVMRTAEGARPSRHYQQPEAFVRGLERDVPELASGR